MKAKVSDRFSLEIVEMWLVDKWLLISTACQLCIRCEHDNTREDDYHNLLAFIKTGCRWVTHAREALFCNFECFSHSLIQGTPRQVPPLGD